MGGGGDKYPFRLVIQSRYVDDLVDKFHHFHHNGITHHCTHMGDKIMHCGCTTITGKPQHATNKKIIYCMLHIPDIDNINNMELLLEEKCPLRDGWYHIASLKTKARVLSMPKVVAL